MGDGLLGVMYVMWGGSRRNQLNIYLLIAATPKIYGTRLWREPSLCSGISSALSCSYHLLFTLVTFLRVFTQSCGKSLCCGLHWNTMVTFIWHTWNEHNRRYKESIIRPSLVVAREFLKDLDVMFDKGKFKGSCRSRLDQVALERWMEALA